MKKAQLITLLIAMGVSQTNAEKIASKNPDDGDLLEQKDLDLFVTDVKTKQSELIKNDSEFLKAIDTDIQKKYTDIQFRKLKQVFGLTSEETKDLDYEAALKLGREKVSKTNNTTLDELQLKNTTLETELKKINEELIPKIRSEVDETKSSIEIENLLVKDLSGTKLRVAMDAALPALKSHLSAQGYKLKKDEKGNLEIVIAATGLKPQSEDKTKILTFNDIRDSKLKDWKMLEESGADNKGKDGLHGKELGGNGGSGSDTKIVSPHLAKAGEHLEKVKAEIAANKK